MCCEGLWFSYKIDAIDKMHSALLFIIMQTHYKTRMSDEPASSNESSILDECACLAYSIPPSLWTESILLG